MKTTSKYYCPYCGSECDSDDREALEILRAKADKIGYGVRCKRNRKGVYEILNDRGFVIGEGTSVEKIGDLLDVLGNAISREVTLL